MELGADPQGFSTTYYPALLFTFCDLSEATQGLEKICSGYSRPDGLKRRNVAFRHTFPSVNTT